MKRRLLYGVLILAAALLAGWKLEGQGNPYAVTLANPTHVTGTGVTAAVPLTVNGLKMSWSGGTVQLVGTSLTTTTLGIQVSPDGTNYYAWPMCTTAATPVCATTQTTTTNALFTVALPAMVDVKFNVTVLTGTAIDLTLSLTPNAVASSTGAGSGSSNTGTQITTNTTFAGATTPQQPGLVQTNTEPTITPGGVVKIRPSAYNQTMVLFGASECQGVGASVYANSWAGLLGTALAAKGYNVINSSINGNTTAQLIARFYTDVAPFRPDIVVLCPLTVNDGYNITTWRTNIIQLAKMIRQIGAVPVVLQPSADSSYTLQEFQNVEDVGKLFASMNIPLIDALSATASSSTGQYLTGLNADAQHPNDAGHLAIFNSVPLTLFDQLIYGKSFGGLTNGHVNEWRVPTTAFGAVNIPITVALDRAVTSFTFAAWFNFVNTSPPVIYLGVLGTNDFTSANNARLRTQGGTGNLQFTSQATGTIDSGLVLSGWHHVALVYSQQLSLYSLYVDGVSVGTPIAANPASAASSFTLMNGVAGGFTTQGSGIGSAYIYRVPLFPQQITELFKGFVHPSALEWGSNFNTFASSSIVVGPTPPNVALTSNTAAVFNQAFDSQ